jgi:hypothetical protein
MVLVFAYLRESAAQTLSIPYTSGAKLAHVEPEGFELSPKQTKAQFATARA